MTYARLQFGVGPKASVRLPVRIDWTGPFAGTDEQAGRTEYDLCDRQFDQLDGSGALDDRLAFAADLRDADMPWEPVFPRSTQYEDG